ncbi:MAG: T9SS type A sorting domain-containing protein [Saprospiraceae bacterium]|nr:T9SS type A sorting domain-containing protein [Saprospiraceae bacterium]
MSKIYHTFILLLLLNKTITFGQGTINGFSYSPLIPTISDSITFYVDVSLPSGSCSPYIQNINVTGFNISASALHCVGMLTYICNYVDTFKVGPLPIGNYTFEMTLSSGFAPTPCSPGIVPDDTKNFTFSVVALTDLQEIQTSKKAVVSPNPATNYTIFDFIETPVELSLYNFYGQLLFKTIVHDKQFKLNTKPFGKGGFFYSYSSENFVHSGKLILE